MWFRGLSYQTVFVEVAFPGIDCILAVRAVCSDRANGRKALPYGMRFSCITNGYLRCR